MARFYLSMGKISQADTLSGLGATPSSAADSRAHVWSRLHNETDSCGSETLCQLLKNCLWAADKPTGNSDQLLSNLQEHVD